MAVNKVVELDNVGSVELQYLSFGLLKFLYGTPEEQTDRAPLVRYTLSDRRLKDISSSWAHSCLLFDQASEAFDQIEKILACRRKQTH